MTSRGLKHWALAIVAVMTAALFHHDATAEPARTVLEEILEIMRQNGQITQLALRILPRAECEGSACSTRGPQLRWRRQGFEPWTP